MRSIAVALTIAVAGVSMGVVAPGASAAPPNHAPGRAEFMTIIFAGRPGAPGTVVARGAVDDVGTLTPTDGDTDSLVFPDGTLYLQEAGDTVVQPPVFPACIVRFATVGTYTVVGGTRRFAGAVGGGTSADSGLEVIGHTGTHCSATPLFVYDRVDLRGTLTTG